MTLLKRVLSFPFRVVAVVWNLAVHGEPFPDRGESFEQRVAAREAQKRVERHGTP